jgi:hydroxymethylglutaryl-CoA lyase
MVQNILILLHYLNNKYFVMLELIVNLSFSKNNLYEVMQDIIIHEVGLRDGLQIEPEPIPSITKIQWADEMIAANIDIIQLGSFVNPKKVFQMADTDDLFENYNMPGNKPEKTILSGLVLNEKGLQRAMACNVDMICMGVSASDTHSLKNTGMTTYQAQEIIIKMAKDALTAGKKVQASVQSAFGCGFEGDIDEEKVFAIIKEYLNAGINTISLADTAGYANPLKVERMFEQIHSLDNNIVTACHFHNTFGMGMANVYAAYKSGVKIFETAFGGLGGCPFTKVAAGNVATEDVVTMFQEMGLRKDIDLNRLKSVPKYASGFLIKDLPGLTYKLGGIKH